MSEKELMERIEALEGEGEYLKDRVKVLEELLYKDEANRDAIYQVHQKHLDKIKEKSLRD